MCHRFLLAKLQVLFMATSVGKFFLIDNLSGEILWSKFVPEMRPFVNGLYIMVNIFIEVQSQKHI